MDVRLELKPMPRATARQELGVDCALFPVKVGDARKGCVVSVKKACLLFPVRKVGVPCNLHSSPDRKVEK